MSTSALVLLVAANIGLIFVLMALPLGVRTLRVSRTVAADRPRTWQALWPLGEDVAWSGEVLESMPLAGGRVWQKLSWEGRDGRPIERTIALSDVADGERFALRVIEDSALDNGFWENFRETVTLARDGDGTRVTVEQADRYRGLAFLAFRYFRLRRQLSGLSRWLDTGKAPRGGVFEHPLTQVGFGLLSVLLLWAIFGMTARSFMLAAGITLVVALHEFGHLAAFRLMGHKRVRMIFVPILGGIAIGGRPYDSRFEVAFVALMGAGFSAFLVPLGYAASEFAADAGNVRASAGIGFLVGVLALFNIANLVPVGRFDGGQVLRQICRSRVTLLLSSFVMLLAFMLVGLAAAFDVRTVLVAGAVFVVLSLLTMRSNVRPRHELKPLKRGEGPALAAALVACFIIHASALVWLADRYQEARPQPAGQGLSSSLDPAAMDG